MPTKYRADHVGSFLRPAGLLEARQSARNAEMLHALEDQHILRVLAKQKELGFEIFTDGELRRRNFMSDFTDAVEGFDFGDAVAYLDMGWPDLMVAVEYDGDHHRVDRQQYLKDIRRLELLERLGWLIVRVVAEDRPAEIVRRVRCALEARRASVQ